MDSCLFKSLVWVDLKKTVFWGRTQIGRAVSQRVSLFISLLEMQRFKIQLYIY